MFHRMIHFIAKCHNVDEKNLKDQVSDTCDATKPGSFRYLIFATIAILTNFIFLKQINILVVICSY